MFPIAQHSPRDYRDLKQIEGMIQTLKVIIATTTNICGGLPLVSDCFKSFNSRSGAAAVGGTTASFYFQFKERQGGEVTCLLVTAGINPQLFSFRALPLTATTVNTSIGT